MANSRLCCDVISFPDCDNKPLDTPHNDTLALIVQVDDYEANQVLISLWGQYKGDLPILYLWHEDSMTEY